MEIFGNSGGFLDWSLNDPVGRAVTDGAGQANGATVSVGRPNVDTGGVQWGAWFDRLVGGAVQLRQAFSGDARMTSYPGTQMRPVMDGNPGIVPGLSNGVSLLMLAGIALAALYVLKK